MKKTDQRITKRELIEEKPMRSPVIDDEVWEVVDERCGRPVPKPHPHPKPEPCPPVPPKPQPTDIKFGDGLAVDGNVVSVQVDNKHCGEYMVVTKHGISIESLLHKLDKMSRMLMSIEKRLTDAESDINKLKRQAKPESITQTIVEKSKSFELDEDGLILLKTNESMIIDEHGKVGVDYDDETIGLVDGKLSTTPAEWVFETEEDSDNNGE